MLKNEQYVLFSPVGNSDPICNNKDGPVMSICRKYRPCAVVLYLSKEIGHAQEKDKRYTECLRLLGEKIGWKYSLSIIPCNKSRDVHKLDNFFLDFKKEIIKLINKYPNYQILLNVSSGTPAMKYTLQILSTLSEIKEHVLPIQVGNDTPSTPPSEFDIITEWENDLDNFVNDNEKVNERVYESEKNNLVLEIKEEILINLIRQYDYFGAKRLAVEIKDIISEDSMELISAAFQRFSLNCEKDNVIFSKCDYTKYCSLENPKYQRLIEYFLWLQIKEKTDDMNDFFRGITPLFINLLMMIVGKIWGISNFDNYFDKNRCWKEDKLNKNTELKKVLNDLYNKQFNPKINASSSQMISLIKNKSKESDLKEAIDKVLLVEKIIRNKTAHTIISTSEIKEELQKNNLDCNQILNALFYMLKYIGAVKSNKIRESYDLMNNVIVKSISKQ